LFWDVGVDDLSLIIGEELFLFDDSDLMVD